MQTDVTPWVSCRSDRADHTTGCKLLPNLDAGAGEIFVSDNEVSIRRSYIYGVKRRSASIVIFLHVSVDDLAR